MEKTSLYSQYSDEEQNIFEACYDNELGYYCEGTDYEEDWHVNTTWDNAEVLKIVVVWESLKARTTSYAADIPLCVAILLDMDVRELLSAPIDDRTRKPESCGVCFPPSPQEFCAFRAPNSKTTIFAGIDDCANIGIPRGHSAYVSPDGVVKVKLHGFMIDLDRIAQSVIPAR